MASHAQTILEAVTVAAQLAIAGEITVIQRDMPKIFEGVEGLPIIIVCETRNVGRRPITFEGQRQCKYVVKVVLIAAANDDHAGKINQFAQWREDLRELFGQDDFLAGAPDINQIEIDDDDSYDVAALSNLGYAYWAVELRYSTTE